MKPKTQESSLADKYRQQYPKIKFWVSPHYPGKGYYIMGIKDNVFISKCYVHRDGTQWVTFGPNREDIKEVGSLGNPSTYLGEYISKANLSTVINIINTGS